jgi:HD-GYP domain-containing protein (c-di-GMP phosphodiesterase class II)
VTKVKKKEDIEKKLKDAGIGHFIDVHARLSDSFVQGYAKIISFGIHPKHVLGMQLVLVNEAIVNIDDPEKLKNYIHSVGPLMSNFIGDDMAFVSYNKVLSEEDREFLEKVERASYGENQYISGMKRVLETVDELNGIKRKKNIATSEHCKRVEKYSERLCYPLGLSDQERVKIRESAGLHDIGRICIPKEIYKSDKLNIHEFEVVKKHPLIGRFILRENGNGYLSDGAAYHHENWDGSGYPYKRTREKIPFSARIIHIADAFDAMTCGRPWGEKKTPEQALDEIVKYAGIQFDPDIAKLEVIEKLISCLNFIFFYIFLY